MRTLRFPKDLYPGKHVDQAIKLYDRFGTLGRDDDDTAWIVTVDAGSRAKTRRLAGELANYALGLTVKLGLTVNER